MTEYLEDNDREADEQRVADRLVQALEDGELWLDSAVARTQTFAEAGLMTNNVGVTVTLDNGAEYQLTVVQSKGADR